MQHSEKKANRGTCRCEDCQEEMRCLIAEAMIEMGYTPPATIKLNGEKA